MSILSFSTILLVKECSFIPRGQKIFFWHRTEWVAYHSSLHSDIRNKKPYKIIWINILLSQARGINSSLSWYYSLFLEHVFLLLVVKVRHSSPLTQKDSCSPELRFKFQHPSKAKRERQMAIPDESALCTQKCNCSLQAPPLGICLYLRGQTQVKWSLQLHKRSWSGFVLLLLFVKPLK